MERKPVKSGNIKTVGYSEPEMLLEIEFHSNAIYRYSNVPKDIYEAFMGAESLGRYFQMAIRSNFPCERLHLETCGKYGDCHIPLCSCFCHRLTKGTANDAKTDYTDALKKSVKQAKKKRQA